MKPLTLVGDKDKRGESLIGSRQAFRLKRLNNDSFEARLSQRVYCAQDADVVIHAPEAGHVVAYSAEEQVARCSRRLLNGEIGKKKRGVPKEHATDKDCTSKLHSAHGDYRTGLMNGPTTFPAERRPDTGGWFKMTDPAYISRPPLPLPPEILAHPTAWACSCLRRSLPACKRKLTTAICSKPSVPSLYGRCAMADTNDLASALISSVRFVFRRQEH